jgi:hypothetical protein
MGSSLSLGLTSSDSAEGEGPVKGKDNIKALKIQQPKQAAAVAISKWAPAPGQIFYCTTL